jgi:hypothetical protein
MRIESIVAPFHAHPHPQAVITEALKEKVLSSGTAPMQRRRRLPAHRICLLSYLE